jgi:O-acetyl-ADP-ribose deacetylase (regulator of RNase III)
MTVEALLGDITSQRLDAIVNAANPSLLGGGGVDGAIHRAAGPALLDECRRIPNGPQGRCPTGEARITGAGKLPCKHVIHTVGPVWYGGTSGEPALLASCYRNSLLVAEQHGLESIAFPNISTGVYGYPKTDAANIAVGAVYDALKNCPSLKHVVFVCFDKSNLALYEELLNKFIHR